MITKYICQRCQHQWVPNIESPKRCPRCKSDNWNPYPVNDRPTALTETESLALHWIANVNHISTDEVFKQRGSPDFVLQNGKSYEVKTLAGRAVYISENQLSHILKSNPTCQLLVFKGSDNIPILSIPVADIISDKVLDTVDVGKHGQIYIKVT